MCPPDALEPWCNPLSSGSNSTLLISTHPPLPVWTWCGWAPGPPTGELGLNEGPGLLEAPALCSGAAMEVRRALSEEHDIEVVGPPPGQGAGA